AGGSVNEDEEGGVGWRRIVVWSRCGGVTVAVGCGVRWCRRRGVSGVV
nr:hypothetical protein [Tanacetum cinerariifolium]